MKKNSLKKAFKTNQILVSILVITAWLIPSVSNAGIIDWLSSFGQDTASKSRSIAYGFLYANSKPTTVQETLFDDFGNASPTLIQDNSFVQLSKILSNVGKGKITGNEVTKTLAFIATAYSSTPDQTDASPFITARGTRVRDGIVATNVLPFGTLIRMPALFGDKVFVVEDRMNSRYNGKNILDVWFADRDSAIKFGSSLVAVEVLGSLE